MPSPAAVQTDTMVPLCVDLDGTLIKTDLLWESLVRLLKQNPLFIFSVLAWWTRGRAHLKAQIARRVQVEVSTLPFNQGVLEFLKGEKQRGRPVYLVTASDLRLARELGEHVGLFKEVLASDGVTNLRSTAKAQHLAERFGERGFDYAGNSPVDLPVWRRARNALVVANGTALAKRASQCAPVGRTFAASGGTGRAVLRSMRLHQWVKNLILFVPLVTSHSIGAGPLVLKAVSACFAFCLCASAIYIINDLMDLEADRHHPVKRSRPFASGELALPIGMILGPLLLVVAGTIAVLISWTFAVALSLYVVLTTSYSWRWKEVPLLDVFCLAGLYTLRLIGGHEATGIAYSFWLLLFSMFVFLSLALVKRFTELRGATGDARAAIKGRGYAPGDMDLVAVLGLACGCLAVLVLALYVNSEDVRILYRYPILLLLACPLLLYWISRAWLLAYRGLMHSDPIVFALKDPASYIVGVLTLLIIWLATGSWIL